MKESRIKKLKIAVWLPLLALIIGAIFVADLVRDVRVENEKHTEKLERMNAETCSERMHGELNNGVFFDNGAGTGYYQRKRQRKLLRKNRRKSDEG